MVKPRHGAGNHIGTIHTQITRYCLYVLIALARVLATLIAHYLLRRRSRETHRTGPPHDRPSPRVTDGRLSPAAQPPT